MAFIQAVPWHSITTPTQRRNGTLRNAAAAGTPGAVEDYKKFLSGGSSSHPIELLRTAGVDMASPQPILDTVAEFSATLDELKKLI